jgi:hypothetical protein
MHTISTVEPRMPFCWRETAFWPDAIGTLLAEGLRGSPKLVDVVEEVLRGDVLVLWEAQVPDGRREDSFLRSFDGRQVRGYLQRNGEGAMLRLLYSINPLLPCGGPAMGQSWILTLPALVAFLEKTAGAGLDTDLLEMHALAFIAARGDRPLTSAVNLALKASEVAGGQLRLLGLLRDLQTRYWNKPLPALAAWMAARLRPQLETYQNHRTREALVARLEALAAEGFLGRLLALVEDERTRGADGAGARRAAGLVAAIDREILALNNSDSVRRAVTARIGRETAAAIGMTALILMLIVALAE